MAIQSPQPGGAPLLPIRCAATISRQGMYSQNTHKEPSMIPWSLLDTARVPGGDGELRLMRRGAEFSIKLGQNELMNSRLSGSEQALATLACDRIRERRRPR